MDKFVVIPLIILAAIWVYGVSCDENNPVPPECKGEAFCDIKPKYYDQYMGSDIDKNIKRSKYWAGLGEHNSNLVELEPKIIMDPDNCGYIEETHRPYTIQAHGPGNGTKLVIQTKLLPQKIRTTKCLDKQQSCFDSIKAQTDSISTECVESYATISVLVLEDGAIQPQDFSVPVSCTCKVQFKSRIVR